MEWRGRKQSDNIEDRRMRSGGGVGRGIGVGTVLILVVGYFLGVDPQTLQQIAGTMDQGGASSEGAPLTADETESGRFVAVVLADTEAVWADILPQQTGVEYQPPVMVLYRDVTDSPCGDASGATGPFYCPADRKVYLDTGFFDTLERQLGAGGDFAAAYVVAHEVAHHVQNQLGILGEANQIRSQVSEAESNDISVRIELQADCLSGVWAVHAAQQFDMLEKGDIAEAVNAARQIGDDTLQRNAGMHPQPHTFTHGTSAQRAAWFKRGFDSGDMGQCDSFAARKL